MDVGSDQPSEAIEPGSFLLDANQGEVAPHPRTLGHCAIPVLERTVDQYDLASMRYE